MRIESSIILESVCENFKITPEELFESTRRRARVEARQIFFFLARKHTPHSLSRLGEIPKNYGKRKIDHSTVSHGANRIEGYLEVNDGYFIKMVSDIKKSINKKTESIIKEKANFLKRDEGYRIKSWMMSQKYHAIINKQREEIELLKGQVDFINGFDVELTAVS